MTKFTTIKQIKPCIKKWNEFRTSSVSKCFDSYNREIIDFCNMSLQEINTVHYKKGDTPFDIDDKSQIELFNPTIKTLSFITYANYRLIVFVILGTAITQEIHYTLNFLIL